MVLTRRCPVGHVPRSESVAGCGWVTVVAKRMAANGSESKAKDSVCLSYKKRKERRRNYLSVTKPNPECVG